MAYPPDAFKLAQDDLRVRHAEIPIGNNNPFVDHILWEIGQLSTKTAYVTIQDARMARYTPPEELVNKPRADGFG